MIENLSKALGIKFHIYKSTKTNGKYSHKDYGSANGFYQNGEIWIDINSGNKGEGLLLFTVSHELVHYMREGSPKSFDKLADFLLKSYAEKGYSVRDLVRTEIRKHTSLNPNEAYEEVIARLCESFLRDAHLNDRAAELYKADKMTANKVLAFLKGIKEKIKSLFTGKVESEIGKIGEKLVKEYDHALDLFVEGIRNASDNLAYAKNTTGEAKPKLMARENIPVTESDLHDYLTVGDRLHVRELKQRMKRSGDSPLLYSDDQIHYFISESLNGNIRNTIKAYGRVGTMMAEDISKVTDGAEDVLGYYLELDSNRIEHMQNHTDDDSDPRNIPLSPEEINKIPEYINGYTDILDYTHRKDGSKRLHIANRRQDGVIVIVELISKGRQSLQPVTAWKNSYETFAKVWGNKIKATNTSQAAYNATESGYKIAFDNSIPDSSVKGNTSDKNNLGMKQERDADYLSAVERGDMQTAQQMVDEAARAAGYTIKAYHGTGEDFTEFDITKSRSYDGKPDYDLPGFYFSASEQEASDYGDAKGYYLSIHNPYQGSLYALAKKQGSFRSRTSDVKLPQGDLRRNAKAVLSKYGFTGKAAQRITEALETVMKVTESGIEMSGEDILADIGDAV